MLGEFARHGMVNIVGGCCGTTPEHSAKIAEAVDGVRAARLPDRAHATALQRPGAVRDRATDTGRTS